MQALDRPDRFPRSSRYDPGWVLGLAMGLHPLWQLEDLLPELRLRPGDRVLDLGCGRGATSVFLAREAGVDVVAVDLWVTAAEVQGVIDAAEVADRVTPLQADVRQLPLRDEEFDAIVSIDAFEYFGTDVHLLPDLLPVLRPGGTIAMTTPTLSVDPYVQTPPAEVTALVGWDAAAWHAPGWWQRHWEADARPAADHVDRDGPRSDRHRALVSATKTQPSPLQRPTRPGSPSAIRTRRSRRGPDGWPLPRARSRGRGQAVTAPERAAHGRRRIDHG